MKDNLRKKLERKKNITGSMSNTTEWLQEKKASIMPNEEKKCDNQLKFWKNLASGDESRV